MSTREYHTISRRDNLDIEVDFEYTTGSSGRTSGPPDSWSPAEGPEINVLRAWYIDPETDIEMDVELTRPELDRLTEAGDEAWLDECEDERDHGFNDDGSDGGDLI